MRTLFTGLIEEMGIIDHIKQHGEVMLLSIKGKKVLEQIAIGDSIAVNGVCLTVTSYHKNQFTADVMPETFRKSSLSLLSPGHAVNLERAMQAGGRFGGHIVQGHVDGIGKIVSKTIDGNAVIYELELLSKDNMRYMLRKGSITIDGISLTIVDTSDHGVKVSIIPHTLQQTALQYKKAGDIVNIEADIIGKYVDHLMNFQKSEEKTTSSLSTSFLAEHGFL